MARRQARFTPQDLAGDPRLQDESPELWNEEFSDVVRALLTSAVRCFAMNGYHATTTRDISGGAGLSPAALYVHFPSKELVLYEIIRSGHQCALTYIQDPSVTAITGAADRLRVVVARHTAWHARHHVAARVAQYELAGLTAEHYEEIVRLRHQTNEVFRAAVARGVEDGTFAAVDVKRVARCMLSLSIDLARWYRLDGCDSPELLGEFYADIALKMVGPGAAPPAGDGAGPAGGYEATGTGPVPVGVPDDAG
ncbi:MAG TPA: TetR/AcrR family transcriptional regulator [Streptosporangiaceae bacterium]